MAVSGGDGATAYNPGLKIEDQAMMKPSRNKTASALTLTLVTLVASQAFGQTKPAAPATGAVAMPKGDRIAMVDFRKLVASGDVVVVDVRANSAYVAGHIPGALSIPLDAINASVAEKLLRMGKPVATYCSCQAEHTAALAAQTLQRMNVPAQAVVGGFNQWVAEKNPVKTGPDAK